MKIIIIAFNYPSKYYPTRGIFVKKLVDEFIKQGVEVTVIAPISIGKKFFSSFTEYYFSGSGKNMPKQLDNNIVYRPFYFSFSNFRIFNNVLSHIFFNTAVKFVFFSKLRNYFPDVIYGHFLLPSGAIAVELASIAKCKSVIALGEDSLFEYDPAILKKTLNQSSGIIAVSDKNKQYVLAQPGISEKKVLLAPNSVSKEFFYPLDRKEMRRKLGLPEDAFIISFVGLFIERKGVHRLLDAVNDLEKDIQLLLIGEGPQKPRLPNDRILVCGKIHNKKLVEYLSASDIFVLPTLSEGSCNAIAEAMACGLPVISSSIPEIKDQVSDKNAILVDPLNIQNLREAIHELYKNKELRKTMGNESLKISEKYSITHRAEKIISFMKNI